MAWATGVGSYEPPLVRDFGTLAEVTAGCQFGTAEDGATKLQDCPPDPSANPP